MNSFEWFALFEDNHLGVLAHAEHLRQRPMSDTWKLTLTDGTHRWARNRLSRHQSMITCEAEQLKQLAATGITCTHPIAVGHNPKYAWLVGSWHTLSQQCNPEQQAQALKQLHKHTSPNGLYGWHDQHYLNGMPQPNHWHDHWLSFFRSQRLVPQFTYAKQLGLAQHLITLLDQALSHEYEQDFANHHPIPSLLHGNLWHQLCQQTSHGAVFFHNPACYYGDFLVDLAAQAQQPQGMDVLHHYLQTDELTPIMHRRLSWYQLHAALVDFNQHANAANSYRIQQLLMSITQALNEVKHPQ